MVENGLGRFGLVENGLMNKSDGGFVAILGWSKMATAILGWSKMASHFGVVENGLGHVGLVEYGLDSTPNQVERLVSAPSHIRISYRRLVSVR